MGTPWAKPRTAASIASAALLVAGCVTPPDAAPPLEPRWVDLGASRALVVGGDDGRGRGDGPVIVYLHGFASRPRDQLPLPRELRVPPGTRFVFPEAPLAVHIPEGPRRAWWLLDRPLRRRLRAEPEGMRELAGHVPEGLTEARARVRALLDAVARTMAPPERTVLAGFSQGAMLAADVALHDERPLAGVALLSGTLISAPAWAERAPARRGLPVFVTHGRRDPLLPYPMAERLVALLTGAGLDVRWQPHGEGHAFSLASAPALARFLAEVLPAEGG